MLCKHGSNRILRIRGESNATVNQPEPRRVPPAAHVAPRGDEAGPSNQPPQGQGVPYPYHPEEVIGGDSESENLVVGPSQQVPLSGSSTYSSFDERVLLEPMPDSSSPSVDEAINAGAPNPPAEAPHGPPPYDPNTDPLRVETKKAEMTLFVKDQLVHFTERGWKPWQLSRTHDHYMEVSSNIVKSLELDSVSEYEEFLLAFRKDPKLLESLFTK
ncbi:hypothetical protein QVD17_30371 [Tagetes erecta]|uniref:Uncharacterized protein n=1 Tax=Tagetes erecta TaxID=13708 RepID=A0AAD8K1S1_TARER|nr:hypothetical protein QVD17_30371 [Tagetes erecta]